MTRTTFLMLTALFIIACNNSENNSASNNKYEQTKQSLEEVEKASPKQFLIVKSHDKKNLLGQTVVKGTISNTAKICTYKDIEVQLSFYSKTGTLLEQDKETIFETIAPGTIQSFKTKYFAPKGTDSIALAIVKAGGEK